MYSDYLNVVDDANNLLNIVDVPRLGIIDRVLGLSNSLARFETELLN